MDHRHQVILGVALLLTALRGLMLAEAPFFYQDEHALTAPPGRVVTLASVPNRSLTMWSLDQTRDPAVAHLVNLGLHLTVGVLVAAVVTPMAGSLVGLVAAVVMLLHPLNHQAVAYVTGRAELLTMVGILLAVSGLIRGGWGWLLCPVGILLAMTSKEMGAVVLPVLFVIMAWQRRAFPAPVLFLGGCLTGIGAMRALPVLLSWATMTPGAGGSELPWSEFVVRANGVIWQIQASLVTLSGFAIEHDAVTLPLWWLALSAAMTAAVGAGAVLAWRRQPIVAVALTWWLVALLPRLLIPTSEFSTERHLYVAQLGPAILLGLAAARWLRSQARVPVFIHPAGSPA